MFRKNLLILLLITAGLLYSQDNEIANLLLHKTDVEIGNLKGKVKKIDEEKWAKTNIFSDGPLILKQTSSVLFDEKGMISENYSQRPFKTYENGELVEKQSYSREVFQFDSKGRLINKRKYVGTFTGQKKIDTAAYFKTVYEYDEKSGGFSYQQFDVKGKKNSSFRVKTTDTPKIFETTKINYESHGMIVSSRIDAVSYFDQFNRLQKVDFSGSGGKAVMEYFYDSAGNLIREIYQSKTSMDARKNEFAYNKKNDLQTLQRFSSKGPGESLVFDYQYDKKGNWIVKTGKDSRNGTITEKTERKISYY